jgi:hypothetical protein
MKIEVEKPQIVKVKIRLGSTEVEMSIEEVQELRKILNDNFGRQEIAWYTYVYPTYPHRLADPYWTVTNSSVTMCISSGAAQ